MSEKNIKITYKKKSKQLKKKTLQRILKLKLSTQKKKQFSSLKSVNLNVTH